MMKFIQKGKLNLIGIDRFIPVLFVVAWYVQGQIHMCGALEIKKFKK